MARDAHQPSQSALPACASQYIAQVTKKMRYRRRARAEVGAELTAHFEDALQECTDPQQREAVARALIEQFGDAKLLAVLCRRAKKRCRPLWLQVIIRSVQAVGVVSLYSVLCLLPLYFGKPVVRVNYVDWLNERWRPAQPSAENARDYFDKAVGLYVEPPEELAPKTNARWSVEWLPTVTRPRCSRWNGGWPTTPRRSTCYAVRFRYRSTGRPITSRKAIWGIPTSSLRPMRIIGLS